MMSAPHLLLCEPTLIICCYVLGQAVWTFRCPHRRQCTLGAISRGDNLWHHSEVNRH